MVHEHITSNFTIEAQKNCLTSYDSPTPIALSNVLAIWEDPKSGNMKIYNDKGQEHKLTESGYTDILEARNYLKQNFVPAKTAQACDVINIPQDMPMMVNPTNLSTQKMTCEDDVAVIPLPNGLEIYLIDAELGFGLDEAEVQNTVSQFKPL